MAINQDFHNKIFKCVYSMIQENSSIFKRSILNKKRVFNDPRLQMLVKDEIHRFGHDFVFEHFCDSFDNALTQMEEGGIAPNNVYGGEDDMRVPRPMRFGRKRYLKRRKRRVEEDEMLPPQTGQLY